MSQTPLSFHHPPTLGYSGLTIIAEPSRHCLRRLIDGKAGLYFEQLLAPFTRLQCDFRTPDIAAPYIQGTKVVLCLGEEAFKIIKPDDETVTINELRGTPTLRNEIIYIPTYLPQDAFDRRNYFTDESEEDEAEKGSEKGHQNTKRRNFRFWLYSDTRKAVRWVKTGLSNHAFIQPECRIYPSIQEACDVLTSAKGKYLYLDIETDKEFNLTCFGFSVKEKEWLNQSITGGSVFVIPFKRHTRQLAYERLEVCKLIQALAVGMRDNYVVLHNSMFDLMVLCWRYRIPFPREIFDTMLAWHRCYPEIEKSLGHLISYLTDLPYHKNEGVFDPHNVMQEQQLWNYNAKDVWTTMLCHWELVNKEIPKIPSLDKSVNQANKSIRPYLTIQYTGIKVDTEKMIKRFSELECKAVAVERVLRCITGRKFNPRSHQQVSEYLYDDLGLEEPDTDPTNEKNLLKLLTKRAIPSIRCILAYRGIRKASSNLKYRLWSKDGGKTYNRLSCSYNIAGTDTYRLSSRKLLKFGPKTGFGTNNQNRDKKEKDLYVPDPGKIFIQVDQAGAEALIVAYLCRNGNFRSLFLNGVKPHVYVGLHLFREVWEKRLNRNIEPFIRARIPELKNMEGWNELDSLIKSSDNWASNERYYFIAKQVCHSSNYDVKAPAFQLNTLLKSEGSVALTIKESKAFLNMYHTLFPEIRHWHLEIQNELSSGGRILRNLFGYPRRFGGPSGDDLHKQAYAFKPQSTVGTITNIAITKIQERIDNGDLLFGGVDLLNNSHDSLLVQCPVEKQVEVAAEVKKEMEQKLISSRGEEFYMKAEIQIGMNWAFK